MTNDDVSVNTAGVPITAAFHQSRSRRSGCSTGGQDDSGEKFGQATLAWATIFDFERTQDLARLEDPELALQDLRGVAVLDEIQDRPELCPALRVLVDRPNTTVRVLVLGSAPPELLQQSSDALAGGWADFHDRMAQDRVETAANGR